MSIRFRLTLWYIGILVFILGLFGVIVWSALAFGLTSQVDQRLYQTADQVLRQSNAIPLRNVTLISVPALEAFQADDIYIQVIDLQDQVGAASQNLGRFDTPLDPDALNQGQTITEVTRGVAHLRVLTQPIITEDQQLLGHLQVGAR